MRRSMTFGEIPSFDEFHAAFNAEVEGLCYTIRSGLTALPMDADGDHNVSQLYDLVKRLSEGDDESQSLASSIMGTLGFEWI